MSKTRIVGGNFNERTGKITFRPCPSCQIDPPIIHRAGTTEELKNLPEDARDGDDIHCGPVPIQRGEYPAIDYMKSWKPTSDPEGS